jgi:hypothetical protein
MKTSQQQQQQHTNTARAKSEKQIYEQGIIYSNITIKRQRKKIGFNIQHVFKFEINVCVCVRVYKFALSF